MLLTFALFLVYLLGAFATLVACELLNICDGEDAIIVGFLWFVAVPLLIVAWILILIVGGLMELAKYTSNKIKEKYEYFLFR